MKKWRERIEGVEGGEGRRWENEEGENEEKAEKKRMGRLGRKESSGHGRMKKGDKEEKCRRREWAGKDRREKIKI